MADAKTTQLSSFTPELTDIGYGVADPGGTPVSGKFTFQALMSLFRENSIVLTRTALKALDTSINTFVYLLEEGRQGVFQFLSGDYSTEVAADTAEGVYIPADSDSDGSEGCWVRQYEGPALVTWYGAVADGGSGDAAANAAAFAACAANNLYWAIPEGTFYVNALTTLREKTRIVGDADRLSIVVASADITILKAENAGTGRTQRIDIENVKFCGQGSGCTATLLDMRGTSYLEFNNVEIWPTIDNLTDKHDGTAIDLTFGGASFNGYAAFRNVRCIGFDTGIDAKVNVLLIEGGAWNDHQTWGIYATSGAVTHVTDIELSGNGSAGSGGGGYIDTTGAIIGGNWYENNGNRVSGPYSPNNIQFGPNCKWQERTPGRDDVSSAGVYHGPADDFTDRGYDRQGRIGYGWMGSRPLIRNGRMELRGGSTPFGWTIDVTAGTVTALATDAASAATAGIPAGWGPGIKVELTGLTRWRQTLIAAADLWKWYGKTISATWMVRRSGSGSTRLGFWHKNTSGMSNGKYFTITDTDGDFHMVTSEITIDNTLTNSIELAFQDTNSGPVLEIAGVVCNVGHATFWDFEAPLVRGAPLTAIGKITTSASSGTLPTPDGTMTFADASSPTAAELLEGYMELEAKLETIIDRLGSTAGAEITDD